LLLTAAALFTHGYHPFSEDGEIYLPGIEKILNPKLFPVGREFFQSHASMTLFPNLIAWSVRLTHVPFEFALFAWHVGSIFLFLLACWQLSCLLFPTPRARWGAVSMIASLLTIPVAGTSLYIMDQYLNPRNLAAFAGVFAVTRWLEKKYLRAALWLVFAACVHPLMWVFPFSFCALWLVLEKLQWRIAGSTQGVEARIRLGCACLAGVAPVPQSSPAYHQAAKLHAYHYLQNWAWFEWLGIVAPLVLLWGFGRIADRRSWSLLAKACRTFVIYGSIYLVIALAVDLPARFESLARIQPMRSLHLLYIFFFLCGGGLMGEFLLRDRTWRWLALFIPLSAGMLAAQRSLFPASAHIEWPDRPPRNPWAQAFLWIQQNTSINAVFAINPEFMDLPGEDEIGFRCLAERSRLADDVKDNGVVSMFPPLAERWWEQIQAQTPWKDLGAADFARLKQKYGVNWVVLQQPGLAHFDCAYENSVVKVCPLP
jgi:hypothetical protein